MFENNFFQSAEVVKVLFTILLRDFDFVKRLGSLQDSVVCIDEGVPVFLNKKRGSKSHFLWLKCLAYIFRGQPDLVFACLTNASPYSSMQGCDHLASKRSVCLSYLDEMIVFLM